MADQVGTCRAHLCNMSKMLPGVLLSIVQARSYGAVMTCEVFEILRYPSKNFSIELRLVRPIQLQIISWTTTTILS
eukprot:439002-Amphidinium_carterae.2